jgi:hypothetical protein
MLNVFMLYCTVHTDRRLMGIRLAQADFLPLASHDSTMCKVQYCSAFGQQIIPAGLN